MTLEKEQISIDMLESKLAEFIPAVLDAKKFDIRLNIVENLLLINSLIDQINCNFDRGQEINHRMLPLLKEIKARMLCKTKFKPSIILREERGDSKIYCIGDEFRDKIGEVSSRLKEYMTIKLTDGQKKFLEISEERIGEKLGDAFDHKISLIYNLFKNKDFQGNVSKSLDLLDQVQIYSFYPNKENRVTIEGGLQDLNKIRKKFAKSDSLHDLIECIEPSKDFYEVISPYQHVLEGREAEHAFFVREGKSDKYAKRPVDRYIKSEAEQKGGKFPPIGKGKKGKFPPIGEKGKFPSPSPEGPESKDLLKDGKVTKETWI